MVVKTKPTQTPQKRLFTVHEYHRMAEAGILHEDDRVELIEGELVDMHPIGPSHAAHVDRLTRLFTTHIDEDESIIRIQGPVQLDDYSEPQPDVLLLRPRHDYYTERHPAPEDVLLLIEVADTSLEYDRINKVPLYARAGIAEVWIVNLQDGVVEVYRESAETGYKLIRRLDRSDSLAPLAFPDVEYAVEEILG